MGQRSHPAMTFWVVLFLVFVASCATQDELRKAKGETKPRKTEKSLSPSMQPLLKTMSASYPFDPFNQ